MIKDAWLMRLVSLTSDNHIEIVENWEEESKAYMAAPHFKRLVPELKKCGTLPLKKITF